MHKCRINFCASFFFAVWKQAGHTLLQKGEISVSIDVRSYIDIYVHET
jgi:uncharacterized protein with PIN domain